MFSHIKQSMSIKAWQKQIKTNHKLTIQGSSSEVFRNYQKSQGYKELKICRRKNKNQIHFQSMNE